MEEDDRCNQYKGGCECKDFEAEEELSGADKEYKLRNCDNSPEVMWALRDIAEATEMLADNDDDGLT